MDDWKDSLVACAVRISQAAERFALAHERYALAHELLALTAADERFGGHYRVSVQGAASRILRRQAADE